MAAGAELEQRAELLAERLGLPMVGTAPSQATTHFLHVCAEGLALGARETDRSHALQVNFSSPALRYRLQTSGKRQGIAKAVGLDRNVRPLLVLDATAGLGRDALVLAHLGCSVTMLERSPLIHALLEDGLQRALEDSALAGTVARMTLYHADAAGWLAAIAAGEREQPDVICLDPMFPERSKSAKVKKDMALLQDVLGPDEDLPAVLELARQCARFRVVVKRPPHKVDLPGPEPVLTVGGKASHFSVYVNRSLSSIPL